jgi:aldehyde dehydrogenase (NAD+)
MIERSELFVDNRLVSANSGARIDVVNPATEQLIGRIPDGDGSDVDTAVQCAWARFNDPDWRATTPNERAALLRALADAIERRSPELPTLVTQQNGMPIGYSLRANGAGPAAAYRYFADLAERYEFEDQRPSHSIVTREPLGVAALIVPWNGPQAAVSWKLAPALAAGCTAVIKPAPETTLDMYLLAEAVIEAGFPRGVVNFVPGGRETGATLVRHPRVAKVSFTGSSAAGKQIAEQCGALLRPVTLELGGKSAAIIVDDADVDGFAPFVGGVCSPNAGQVCRATTRILAPASKYEAVVEVVSQAMADIVVGDPFDEQSVFGPLVAARQRDRVEGYIAAGLAEGARVTVGGGRPRGLNTGYYIEPTVFRDVTNDMKIAREEIFGPVLVVIPYRDDEDAIRIANDSNYGLGGLVYGADVDRATAIARRIEAGTVGVNHYANVMDTPFGGYKESGLGRELGPEGLEPYLQIKSIYRAAS